MELTIVDEFLRIKTRTEQELLIKTENISFTSSVNIKYLLIETTFRLTHNQII